MRGWLFPMLLVGCTTASSTPNVPPFRGVETQQWLVEESEPIARDDLLPAFEASARSYGCSTDQIGRESSSTIYGA